MKSKYIKGFKHSASSCLTRISISGGGMECLDPLVAAPSSVDALFFMNFLDPTGNLNSLGLIRTNGQIKKPT